MIALASWGPDDEVPRKAVFVDTQEKWRVRLSSGYEIDARIAYAKLSVIRCLVANFPAEATKLRMFVAGDGSGISEDFWDVIREHVLASDGGLPNETERAMIQSAIRQAGTLPEVVDPFDRADEKTIAVLERLERRMESNFQRFARRSGTGWTSRE